MAIIKMRPYSYKELPEHYFSEDKGNHAEQLLLELRKVPGLIEKIILKNINSRNENAI